MSLMSCRSCHVAHVMSLMSCPSYRVVKPSYSISLMTLWTRTLHAWPPFAVSSILTLGHHHMTRCACITTWQGPGRKPRTGSTKIKIAETAGIIHLYVWYKVSRSFGEKNSGASSPRFHPRALMCKRTVLRTVLSTVCRVTGHSKVYLTLCLGVAVYSL